MKRLHGIVGLDLPIWKYHIRWISHLLQVSLYQIWWQFENLPWKLCFEFLSSLDVTITDTHNSPISRVSHMHILGLVVVWESAPCSDEGANISFAKSVCTWYIVSLVTIGVRGLWGKFTACDNGCLSFQCWIIKVNTAVHRTRGRIARHCNVGNWTQSIDKKKNTLWSFK